jgi:microcystin-dependent protein
MPTHLHFAQGTTTDANSKQVTNDMLARSVASPYSLPAGGSLITFPPDTVTNVGGSQAHTNMQPYLVLNFIIALIGIFPSQN